MREVKSAPGSLRAERAAATRRRIEDAARRTFRRRGYAATTLREVADEAEVAVQTVYAVFGSKAAILRSLRLAVVGDPEADAAWAEALGAPDVATALAAFARSMRLRWEHGADVVAINTDAARADPAIASEVEVAVRIRRTGIGELARALVALDPALGPVARVTASLEAATLADAYLLLTGAHGWPPDDYERWLAGVLRAGLGRAPGDPSA